MSELDVSAFVATHTYGTWRPQKGWKPLHVTKAEGCHFYDASGKRYLDMSAQLMCSNLGHQNAAVVEAICKQAKELCFVAPGFATTVRAQLAQTLLDVVPKGIEKFFFAVSTMRPTSPFLTTVRAPVTMSRFGSSMFERMLNFVHSPSRLRSASWRMRSRSAPT